MQHELTQESAVHKSSATCVTAKHTSVTNQPPEFQDQKSKLFSNTGRNQYQMERAKTEQMHLKTRSYKNENLPK